MTAEEYAVIVNAYSSNMQLPAAFSRLAELLKRLPDAESNHAAQQSLACATAAQNDNKRLMAALQGASSYATSAAGAVASYKGTVNVVLGGAVGAVGITAAIPATWVTANSQIEGYIPMLEFPFGSGVWFFFAVSLRVITPGVSFTMIAQNVQGAPPGGYTIYWTGSP